MPQGIGQRGSVQKLFEMEKTSTDSKGIIQLFANLRNPTTFKSRNQLQLYDVNILIFVESCTPLSVFEQNSFRIFIGNLDSCVTPISITRLMQKLIPVKCGKLQLLLAHSRLNSISFVCLLVYG